MFLSRTKVSDWFATSALVLGLTLPNISLATNAHPDAHLGTFLANQSYGHSIQLERFDGVDYIESAWGKAPVVISANGEFKSIYDDVALSGKFSRLEDGLYQAGDLTYQSYHYTFNRIPTLTGQERVTKLFDLPYMMTPIGGKECQDWLLDNSVNYDKAVIDRLVGLSQEEGNPYQYTTSLLIAKDGKLVVEEYFNGWDASFPHTMQSVTKSMTSLAVGAAIGEGLLKNEQQRLKQLMPTYASLLQGDKQQITLAHMLMMGAGLDWNEWAVSYESPNNPRLKEMASLDPISYVLDRDLEAAPGEKFRYNGGLVTTVGILLAQQANVRNLAAYWQQSSLAKLCFTNAYMTIQNQGVTNAAGGGLLRPRDMLKIGQLVAQDGIWQGERILPEGWIERSTTRYLNAGSHDYGYYWWLDDAQVNGVSYEVVYALGIGGQVIAIVDALNLVVARTATSYNTPTPNQAMMEEYIIPAFIKQ